MAIVVSEETGTISLVEGGVIRRGLDGPALKGALLRSLGLAPETASAAEHVAKPSEGRS
jgi:hypothetical protein